MSATTTKYPNLLIVIGASAGGLQQIIRIVEKLPTHFQATLLVACHREPSGPNMLQDILTRHTGLRVRQPVEGEKLCCTTIYVGSPAESVEIDGNRIHSEIDVSDVARMERIDDLFITAAQSARENTVGVILTGMLSDGVEGLKAIHAAGGYCIVQDPKDAKFESMPKNALAEVEADFVGTSDEIAERLIRLAEGRSCEDSGDQAC